mgnify:CR=1 FL=1
MNFDKTKRKYIHKKSSSPVESHGRVTAHSPNVQSLLSVDLCLLSVDNRRLKRQQKTIFPIITLFTFAEQQPC